MRFCGSKFALVSSLFTLALPLVTATAFAQQVTYYDFDTPQANPNQISRSCSTTAPAGALFCFNDGTGANVNPSFLSDTFPAIIDPVTTDNPPLQSTHYAVQMTPAALTQASSMWFSVPQKVANGFTSYFAFKFTPNANAFSTADGLAFVIQNSAGGGNQDGCPATGAGLSIVGGNGGCIGYGGIDNSVAIELDTYRNFWDPDDNGSSNQDNHISIQNCGAGLANSPDHQGPCQVNFNVNGQLIPAIADPAGVTLADGNVHQVVIQYSGPNEATPYLLQIFIDPVFVAGTHTPVAGSVPALSGIYNIGNNVNLINSGTANDSAYVGFTSATGGGFEQQEVMAWTFTPHTTVTLTQPLNPPGTPTVFPFGTHTYTVTYPPNGPSTAGIDMVVTANAIAPVLFSQLVAGGPFTGSTCQVYDDTGGNCIVYSVSCVTDATGAPTQCPPTDPSNPIIIKTAYNNTVQPISPGLIQGDPFFTQVTSIVGSGSTATVTCVGECAVTPGQKITVEQNSIGGYNGPVTVLTADPTTPNTFTYASTATGTGTGGFLTSTNLQNVFVSYIPQRVDGSTTGKIHTYSDFVATSLTAAPTALVISAPAEPYGVAAPVTVTASSGNGTPTGSISLSVDGKPATSSPLSNGVASFSLTGLTAVTHSLSATYAQTGVFQGATQTGSIVISPIAPTVTFTGAPPSAAYKTTFVVAATTTASTKAVIKASGSCSISSLTVTINSGTGTCNLTATWAADINYTAASLTQTTNATGAMTTVNIATQSPNPANLQSPVVIGFSVTAASGGTPTGKYTVTSNVLGDPSCSANLTSGGLGTCTMNFPTPGVRTLTVAYLGTTNFAPGSTPVQESVTSVPLATLLPTAVSFGTVFQGSIQTQSVVVTNSGSLPMTVSNPYLTTIGNGNSNNFIAINSCPATLAPGQSCTIYVVFNGGMGANQTATLQIVDSAPNSPQSVPISANVTAFQITLSPNPIAFGTQGVGTSSGPIPVTLTNTGVNPAYLAGISLVGPDGLQFSTTNNCPRTLTTGVSCTINVTFSPTQAGSFAPYLRVLTTTNTGTGFQQAPITGTAQ